MTYAVTFGAALVCMLVINIALLIFILILPFIYLITYLLTSSPWTVLAQYLSSSLSYLSLHSLFPSSSLVCLPTANSCLLCYRSLIFQFSDLSFSLACCPFTLFPFLFIFCPSNPPAALSFCVSHIIQFSHLFFPFHSRFIFHYNINFL